MSATGICLAEVPGAHFRGNGERKPGNRGNAASCRGRDSLATAHRKEESQPKWGRGREVCALLAKNLLFILLQATSKASLLGMSLRVSTALFHRIQESTLVP